MIPHSVGFARMASFLIDTREKYRKEMAFLDRLEQTRKAQDILDAASGKNNPQGLQAGGGKPTHPWDILYSEIYIYLLFCICIVSHVQILFSIFCKISNCKNF